MVLLLCTGQGRALFFTSNYFTGGAVSVNMPTD